MKYNFIKTDTSTLEGRTIAKYKIKLYWYSYLYNATIEKIENEDYLYNNNFDKKRYKKEAECFKLFMQKCLEIIERPKSEFYISKKYDAKIKKDYKTNYKCFYIDIRFNQTIISENNIPYIRKVILGKLCEYTPIWLKEFWFLNINNVVVGLPTEEIVSLCIL